MNIHEGGLTSRLLLAYLCPVARQKTHDDELKQRLVQAATELLATQGEDFGLRSLADSQGTSTTAIYSLFGSRGKLLEAVAERSIQRFAEATGEVNTDDPLRSIFALGVTLRAFSKANPAMFEVVFGSRLNSDYMRTLRWGARQPLRVAVEATLAKGLAVGDPQLITTTLHSAVHGFIRLEQIGEVSGDDEFFAMLGHLFDAFATPEGHEYVTSGPLADAAFVRRVRAADPAEPEAGE